MSVIASLTAMLEDGQDNPLIRFGLANAYLFEEKPEDALPHYEEAIHQDARYTAAWKMYARALEMMLQFHAAKQAYQKGIEVAEMKGDFHAAKEMRSSLKQLRDNVN